MSPVITTIRSHMLTIYFFVFDVKHTGQSHIILFQFFMNHKAMIVWGKTTQNMTFINSTTFDKLDSLFVLIDTQVSHKVNYCTDIVQIYGCVLFRSTVVFRQLMEIKNQLILVLFPLLHIKIVLNV